ncbi:N-acetylmuramoyl-L-alanine amidase [Tumidithrix helvetica PCC 7403]|uniref:N-acetylmuramoyl-L-alanine amidase n=1 Tax=Tumidithrix helvetica TaxID=3457545 RepID=UPI003C88CF2D
MKYKQLWFGISFCLVGYCCGTSAVLAQSRVNPVSEESVLQAQINPTSLNNGFRLRGVQASPDGLLLLINGSPQVNMWRVANPDRMIVDLQGTEVASEMHGSVIPLNRYGVKQVRVAQFQQSPAIARLVFDLDPNTANTAWRSSFNPASGVLVLKPTGATTPTPQPSPLVSNGGGASTAIPATIQALVVTSSGQLIIQADQGFTYRGSQDLTSNTYNLTITPARISAQLQKPTLSANSPLERIRMTQVGNSVLIGIQTTAGWRLQDVGSGSARQVSLSLYRPKGGTIGQIPSSTIPTPTTIPSTSVPSNRGRGLVVIDPGHGGPDVGAIGNGIYEKNVVLPIAFQLGRALQQMGYSVVYTRTGDIDLDLEPRVQVAENVKGDVFVSVHANSLASRANEVSGIETYYAPGAVLGQQLASAVHQQLIAGTGAIDRGVRAARFYVIRNTTMPAILVETGFVTNPRDAANLNNPAYQERMGAAIARGVDQFMRYYRR